MYVCTHAVAQMPIRGQLAGVILSFQGVDTRDQTLVARADGRHIYSWHQFAGPLNQLHSLNPWHSGEIHGSLTREKKILKWTK